MMKWKVTPTGKTGKPAPKKVSPAGKTVQSAPKKPSRKLKSDCRGRARFKTTGDIPDDAKTAKVESARTQRPRRHTAPVTADDMRNAQEVSTRLRSAQGCDVPTPGNHRTLDRRELIALMKKRYGSEISSFQSSRIIAHKEVNAGGNPKGVDHSHNNKSIEEVARQMYIRSNGHVQPAVQKATHSVRRGSDDSAGTVELGDDTPPVRPPPPARLIYAPPGRRSSRDELIVDSVSPTVEIGASGRLQILETDRNIQHLPTRGVVFLQYKDVVKRSHLPPTLSSLDTLKALFVAAFPGKVAMPHFEDGCKTIYIKDQDSGVFYQLEDLTDVLDKSFLKIQETEPSEDSLSESESQSKSSRVAAKRAQTFSYPPEYRRNRDYAESLQDVTVQPKKVHRSGSSGSVVSDSAVSSGYQLTKLPQHISAGEEAEHVFEEKDREAASVGRGSSDERGVATIEEQLNDLTALLKNALDEGENGFDHDSVDYRDKTLPGRLDPDFIERIQKKGEEKAKKSLGRLFQPTALVLAQKESDKQAPASGARSKPLTRRHTTSAARTSDDFVAKPRASTDGYWLGTDFGRTASKPSPAGVGDEDSGLHQTGPIVDLKAKVVVDDKSSVKLQSVENSGGPYVGEKKESIDTGRTKSTLQNRHKRPSNEALFDSDTNFSDAFHAQLLDQISDLENEAKSSAVVNGPISSGPSRPSAAVTTITATSRRRVVSESSNSSVQQNAAQTLPVNDRQDTQPAKEVNVPASVEATRAISRSKITSDVDSTTAIQATAVPKAAESEKERAPLVKIEKMSHSRPPLYVQVGSQVSDLATPHNQLLKPETAKSLDTETSSSKTEAKKSVGTATQGLGHMSAKMLVSERKVAASQNAANLSTGGRSNLPEIDASVSKLRTDLRELRNALGELRLAHISNAYDFKKEMQKGREAFMRHLQQQHRDRPADLSLHLDAAPARIATERELLKAERNAYQSSLESVEFKLQRVEENIEELRQQVVTRKRIDDVSKLTTFNEQLQDVTQGLVCSKDNFQQLHESLKGALAAELASIVHEEEFLKSEPGRIESLIARVRQASGTLYTMQKLASVQQEVANSAPANPTAKTSIDGNFSVKAQSERKVSTPAEKSPFKNEVNNNVFASPTALQMNSSATKTRPVSDDSRDGFGENRVRNMRTVRFVKSEK